MQWEFPSFLSSRLHSISRKLKKGGVREERSHLTDITHWMAARDGNNLKSEAFLTPLPSLHSLLPTKMTSAGSSRVRPPNVKMKGIWYNQNSNLNLSRQGTILAGDGRKEVTPRNPKESRIYLLSLRSWRGPAGYFPLSQFLLIWANGKECQALASLLNMLLYPEI